MLYSHDQLYKHICTQNHNDDTIKTSGHSSLEKYTYHFIERVVCERELEIEQNCNILTPTLLAIIAFLSCSTVLLFGCWFSLPHLIFNWLNFLCTELYNCSTPSFFLWVPQIALIQPVHGQGYILIFLDRIHLLFTQVHFLFWQPGRVGGQYTTTGWEKMY